MMLRIVDLEHEENNIGRQATFKNLFDLYYGDLVNYANSYLYDMSQSEDVVQDVFVKLWTKSTVYQIKKNKKSYLYAMVRNSCLNHLKKYHITDYSKVLEESHPIISPRIFMEEESSKDVALEQVHAIMNELPQKMRAIVELRFINQYRYKEIAEELNLSVNTVKTQLQRAKAKFSEVVLAILLLFGL